MSQKKKSTGIFSEDAILFNASLEYTGALPSGIRAMNPFTEAEVSGLSSAFYRKFYNDTNKRHLILGINPGRFGAGVTGVPFTDTKRLKEQCGISYTGKDTHEPSSVFIYEMIRKYGGLEKFYGDFYINSVFPLALVRTNEKGKEVNYNYYDSKELEQAVYPCILETMQHYLSMNIYTDICFCLGTGKNEKFLRRLNEEHKYFDEIIALEHPRFIMQYKSSFIQDYAEKYVLAFRQAVTANR
ncbi:uracil-DNA glycosylase family protein [Chitinophagaceae bacterium MMS25-I14]